jgi:hypothetical protein
MSIIVWNRRFQPAALALSFVTFSLALSWLLSDRFAGFAQVATIVFAFATGTLLIAAWFANSQRLLGYGYLISAGLWVFTAWAALVSSLTLTSILIALGWAILAGGSYLLEVIDGDGRWLP